jgi:hypothetical protein
LRGRVKVLGWLIAAVFTAFIGTVIWNAIAFSTKQIQVNQVDAVEPLRGFEERLARAAPVPHGRDQGRQSR